MIVHNKNQNGVFAQFRNFLPKLPGQFSGGNFFTPGLSRTRTSLSKFSISAGLERMVKTFLSIRVRKRSVSSWKRSMASKRKISAESVSGASTSKVRRQIYLKSYENDFPWVRASKDISKAFCKLCFVEVSISHGGKHDLAKHERTAKHKANKASAGCTNISAALKFQSKGEDLQVIRAETLMTQFLAQQNISLASADGWECLRIWRRLWRGFWPFLTAALTVSAFSPWSGKIRQTNVQALDWTL